MNRLVDRFGRTGFAALTSLIWALPMAAWAGSSDLSPIDKTAYPRIAATIGGVMFVVWLILLAWLLRVPVTPRQHRFAVGQMSPAEKRWTLVLFVFGTGLIAWLNAAATVDWTPLIAAVGSGKVGPIVLATILAILLIGLVVGTGFSWRRANAAFRARAGAEAASSLSNVR